jgi:transketolase
MHTVKPIDGDIISQLADRCHTIATIEEHSIFGGLGSVVARVIADRGLGTKVRLKAFALPDEYVHEAGSQEYLRRRYGLTADQIAGELLQ